MFWRRREVTFLRPKRDLRAIYSAATQGAGTNGTDSLDLLTAAAREPAVAKLIRKLGVDPAAVEASASGARVTRQPDPGFTDDAKRVVEALSNRALDQRREPSGADLLLVLATTDTAAQGVLSVFGIDQTRIRPLTK
jgi:hypothetical protein